MRRTKDRGNWILLIENIRREKLGERRGRKQMMEMETRANLTPDNNDVMSRTSPVLMCLMLMIHSCL